MDHFIYKDAVLHAEEVPLPVLAEAVSTPFYCYSTATLERHYTVFAEAFTAIPTHIHFAVKANSNLAVLKTLAKLGAGADTVSEGEIRRALAAGILPKDIVFSGVGKTRDELRYALEQQVGQYNIESAEELEMLNEVAGEVGTQAATAVRVNPDVDAGTHDHITTGRAEDKFGVAWEQAPEVYARAAELSHIKVVGVAVHIGSQLTELGPFDAAFEKVAGLVEQLRAEGHDIRRLDLGGGLGIPYDDEQPPHPNDYAQMIIDRVEYLEVELQLEPGRLIAGNAGILVTRVVRVKHAPERSFVVVDAAMNDLLRPSLYGARHEIVPVVQAESSQVVDIVGPVCESADVFGRDRELPEMEEGDLLAIRSAGAYGAVMAGTYNSRLLVPEVMVKGGEYMVVRPRPDYKMLLGMDVLPEGL